MPTLRQPDQVAIGKWQQAARDIHFMVQQDLRDAQDHEERVYNRGRIAIKFEIDDQVDLFREGIVVDTNAQKPLKLTDKWIGPFSVLCSGPHPDTYELDLSGLVIGDIWPVFHVNILRRQPIHCAHTRQLHRQFLSAVIKNGPSSDLKVNGSTAEEILAKAFEKWIRDNPKDRPGLQPEKEDATRDSPPPATPTTLRDRLSKSGPHFFPLLDITSCQGALIARIRM
ncbi:hypothetical protein BDZ88DRAFT_456631 [Geranomyces variabilis]|nr:hypothetical protein BDZ88DRAFT_456631 [Geranomyces variabilis]